VLTSTYNRRSQPNTVACKKNTSMIAEKYIPNKTGDRAEPWPTPTSVEKREDKNEFQQ
jgi:hypothetical protein